MKLYLSSYRIPNLDECRKLTGVFANLQLGIIINAKDYRPKDHAVDRINDLKQYLQGLGFEVSLIDLRQFARAKEGLIEELKRFDVLYAIGGNQLALMLAINDSGFENALKNFLEKGGVYIGESAGAMVIGKYIDLDEDQRERSEIEGHPLPEFGMQLIDESILPHADSEYGGYGARAQKLYKELKGKEKLILLNDDQALLINGSEKKIIDGKIVS